MSTLLGGGVTGSFAIFAVWVNNKWQVKKEEIKQTQFNREKKLERLEVLFDHITQISTHVSGLISISKRIIKQKKISNHFNSDLVNDFKRTISSQSSVFRIVKFYFKDLDDNLEIYSKGLNEYGEAAECLLSVGEGKISFDLKKVEEGKKAFIAHYKRLHKFKNDVDALGRTLSGG